MELESAEWPAHSFRGMGNDGGPGQTSDGPKRVYNVVLIEDNPGDVLLIKKAMTDPRFAVAFHELEDGCEVLPYLAQRNGDGSDDDTDLIILDSSLHGTSGLEVLGRVKADDRFKAIPVVVFAGSVSPDKVRGFYEAGAPSFVMKPVSFLDMKRAMITLQEYYFRVAELPSKNWHD